MDGFGLGVFTGFFGAILLAMLVAGVSVVSSDWTRHHMSHECAYHGDCQ